MPRFLVVPRMLFPFRLVSDSLKNHVVCESYRSLWYTGRQSGIGHDRCENYAYWFLLFWDIWRNFRSRRYQKDMPFSRRTGQHSVHQAVFEMQRLCTVILYQSETSVQQDNFWYDMLSERSGLPDLHWVWMIYSKRDIVEYLRPGDCLVINDTKVIPLTSGFEICKITCPDQVGSFLMKGLMQVISITAGQLFWARNGFWFYCGYRRKLHGMHQAVHSTDADENAIVTT